MNGDSTALLLHNLADDVTPSMHRYGVELSAALQTIAGRSGIDVVSWGDTQPRLARRLSSSQHATRADSAFGRYVYYPLRCGTLRADLFHILDQGYAQLMLGLPSRRTIVTCHDVIPLLAEKGVIDMPLPRTVGPSFRFRLGRMRHAARIIADSHATRQSLIEHAGFAPEHISVIHPGLNECFRLADNLAQRAAVRRRFDIPGSAKVVLHVGTSGRYKNSGVLLRALGRLAATSGNAVALVRVGSDFAPDEWTLIDDLKLRPLIHFLGRLEADSDLAAMYAAADALAFPSLWEGFGWPPLEAMACGLPVVVSNRGSLPEVVGDAALVVDADDDAALAEALGRLLTDVTLSRDMIGKGLARARRFTWASCAEQTLQVYNDVLRQQAAA